MARKHVIKMSYSHPHRRQSKNLEYAHSERRLLEFMAKSCEGEYDFREVVEPVFSFSSKSMLDIFKREIGVYSELEFLHYHSIEVIPRHDNTRTAA